MNRLSLVLVYVAVTFTVAYEVDKHNFSPRKLEETDVCEKVTKRIREEYPAFESCNCITSETNNQSIAEIDCFTCEFCSLGTCATGVVQAIGGDELKIEECWEYTTGGIIESKVCLSDLNGDACQITHDGNLCNSCQLQTCSDRSETYLADCTNLEKGTVIDGCTSVQLEDEISRFLVFDERYNFEQCGRRNTSSVGKLSLSIVTGFISYLILDMIIA